MKHHPKQFRVRNVVNQNFTVMSYYPVHGPAHAVALINALSLSQELDRRIKFHSFGLEVWDDSDLKWVEWLTDDGKTITNRMTEVICTGCNKPYSQCDCLITRR